MFSLCQTFFTVDWTVVPLKGKVLLFVNGLDKMNTIKYTTEKF